MSQDSLKKQILRQTVKANLDLRDGKKSSRQSISRPPKRRRGGLVALLALAVPLATFAAYRAGRVAEIPKTEVADLTPTTVETIDAPRWVSDPSALTFRVPEDSFDASVLPLKVRRIVLDPGHGGRDGGASRGEVLEKDMVLDISLRLRTLLQEDFEVLMTREDDTFISLQERGVFANEAQADLFVSIHINWIQGRGRGIETYLLGPTDDPVINEIARRENRNSGYSLADSRQLLQGIYLDVRHSWSRSLAERTQNALWSSLLEVNPNLENRGVKTAPFVVLVATQMPAILAEVSSLSNPSEAELLERPLYRQHIAEALARGIRGYARDVDQTEEKESS